MTPNNSRPHRVKPNSIGAGLRPPHYSDLLNRKSTSIEWFEVISENFIGTQGRPLWVLEQIRRDYPVAFHGVSLSIGSPDPINFSYLKKLKTLIQRMEPFLVSDHFCWTGFTQKNTHNLLPLTLNQRTIDYLISRIHQVQDFLGKEILLENASAYVQWTDSDLCEWDFINEVCEKSGCGVLLDINNLYVTCTNFQIDPKLTLKKVPIHHVKQIHLAGHSVMEGYLLDTHSKSIQDPVWELFDLWNLNQFSVPTMIEWDDEIPSLKELESEVNQIRNRASMLRYKLNGESNYGSEISP